ncbi:3-oxoacyl-ACP synthase III family protein [Marinoscillum sp.]|uniref:3-oxoacyl-ACP synthase III family protein n=1 Tax=Marinoscillum sp. TaxID=2024838 RepID=UPI003BAB2ECB
MKITGISTQIPRFVAYNHDIEWIPSQLKHRLIEVIGIDKRHIAASHHKLSDFAVMAAKDVLTGTGIDPRQIGIILLITQTGDQQVPNTVVDIQTKLGLPNDTLSLELNMGCSGFVHGLHIMERLLKNDRQDHGLLICGDLSSRLIHDKDSGTVPLFSDGVSATLISKQRDTEWNFKIGNNGQNREAISMLRTNDSVRAFEGSGYLKLDGHQILNFGLKSVVPGIEQLLENEIYPAIDYYFFHQASKIINNSIRNKLNIPEEKCPMTLDQFGNMSSATIPITMSTIPALTEKENRVMLCGFGTGLSWGATVVNLPPIDYFRICEF